jgi:uncharacterized protein
MHRQHDQLILSPSDLSNFGSCRHLTKLDRQAAYGETRRPARYGPLLDELRERGLAHERAYLAHLRAQSLEIVSGAQLEANGGTDRLTAAETLMAMRAGADVIYQGSLADDHWSGHPDFLRRTESPSVLGGWSYEVIDTKLARDTRAGTILQLCVYSHLLDSAQGKRPEQMYVVIPGNDFEPLPYRTDDYAAYFRLLARGIGQFIVSPATTYPELVAHCDLCAWWEMCEARRRSDDYLCYVAGISGTQIQSLREVGVNRLEEFARLDIIPDPSRGSREALVRMRDQARIQWRGRQRRAPCHELRQPFDQDHGFALLPEPTPDDIFLDFEGNHFAEGGVREYLTGYLARAPGGQRTYTAHWSRTPEEERAAFERFVDLAIETRARHPGAHIYHFAPYEPTALKHLMGRYATREVELDQLLRGKAFVDLHLVVRRSLIASVERYSIKDLEPFCGYTRQQELRQAAMSRRIIEHAIEAGEWGEAVEAHRQIVEDYNREDCESAERLRDWLEKLRAAVVAAGQPLPRPDPTADEASAEISELDRELRRLRDALLAEVPADPQVRNVEQQARFVLAHLMEFHRREDKASWWEYFRLLELDEADYFDERRALIGLERDPHAQTESPLIHRYRFPPQDSDARHHDDVYRPDGQRIGEVVAVNYTDRTIDIQRTKKTLPEHPASVILHNRVPSDVLRKSLMAFGESVLQQGFAGQAPYRAAQALLLRQSPLAADEGSLQRDHETAVEAACRIALQLDGQVLAIQGPPGTGKTYTGAQIICALTAAGRKVGVTAVSHRVILNLLEEVASEAHERGFSIHIARKSEEEYEGEWDIDAVGGYDEMLAGLKNGCIGVVGATAWGWARPEFAQSVDVLVVDEAGQMALANVLAVAPAGRSVILLGDPQQLEQPLQSSHPEGSEVSALYHWLGQHDTMPPEHGLFLGETHRLHPDIARFTSEVYYERRLVARPELIRQQILPRNGQPLRFSGAGLRYLPVEHAGNQSRSPEEVAAIRGLVFEFLTGARWQDKDGRQEPLTVHDILIVAPYNAQVAALIEALPELASRIGTVDRFQGQEAAVVIYSMTSSSPNDAPRGMEFLYDSHRFNVATSRARALCILVGNPALFEPECRTPRQMKRANGFCRYLELCDGVLNPVTKSC